MTDETTSVAGEQLKSIIERIERLIEEESAIKTDIKEVYAESKANGFDVKTIRQLVMLRRKDANQVSEEEALMDLYKSALGMSV